MLGSCVVLGFVLFVESRGGQNRAIVGILKEVLWVRSILLVLERFFVGLEIDPRRIFYKLLRFFLG